MKQVNVDELNFDEIRFSSVTGIKDKFPKTVTLATAISNITGDAYAQQIARIREAVRTEDKKSKDALKKALSGFLFSGTFNRRKNEEITSHSGLMVLVFDDVDISEKNDVANDSHVALVFVSPSGKGFKALVRIEPNATTHKESFETARNYFISEYGLEADKKGSDLARLCFVSHDPDAKFKYSVEVLHRPHMTTHDHIDHTSNRGAPPGPPAPDKLESPLYGLCNSEAIEYVIQATQPTQLGQRHFKVFDLVRGLHFDGGLAKKELRELKPYVKRWYEIARDKIGTKSFDETWMDFVHAWPRVKKPLFDSATALETAWEEVEKGNHPPIASEYDSPEVVKLVSLCWHLSKSSGTFYLAMNRAAALLSVHSMTVQRWLEMLAADAVLEVVTKGTRHLATTYRWIAESRS